jgi:hypothetical protein
MPSPKSGSAGSAVPPAEPKVAEDADSADPGEVEKLKADQRQSKSGKYGSEKTKPFKPGSEDSADQEEETKKSWIEIELVDEENQPVAGEPYRVTLPDGATAAEGTLDGKGRARVEGIDPGTCTITFPHRDKAAWKKA